MDKSAGKNTSHQLRASHLGRKTKAKLVQPALVMSGLPRDLKVESMGDYILSNIHSNRKDIMNLYTNGVFRHKKSQSFNISDILGQSQHISLLKKHLQTQDFKRQFIINQQRKPAPQDKSRRKVISVSNCLQAYAPFKYTKRPNKPIMQPLIQRKTTSLQHFLNKTHKKKAFESKSELPLLEKRKKPTPRSMLPKMVENNDLNPWQIPVKGRLTSQPSYRML